MSSPLTRKFRKDRLGLLRAAIKVHDDFKSRGITLSLWQMHYQLVDKRKLKNTKTAYKMLGETLTVARYQGLYPLDGLADSSLNPLRPLTDVAESRWYRSSVLPYVWVGSESLAGVFNRVCTELDVDTFACWRYPSVTAMHTWCQHVHDIQAMHLSSGLDIPTPVVVYFGDHTPDGFDMPNAVIDTTDRGLMAIQQRMGVDLGVVWTRAGLTMDQINEHDVHAAPTKAGSSARALQYTHEHGATLTWALNALNPDVLVALIRSEVETYAE